jgi:hypothetical protein
MLKAVGTVIVLYAITQMMSSSFNAFEGALSATFKTIEVAALVSQAQLNEVTK